MLLCIVRKFDRSIRLRNKVPIRRCCEKSVGQEDEEASSSVRLCCARKTKKRRCCARKKKGVRLCLL
ncbi:hypothetical protein GBA52_020706 [Prunus armeniaca]|nr:hypothetical protein GBA52_020706 [Prunus armeniaca]